MKANEFGNYTPKPIQRQNENEKYKLRNEHDYLTCHLNQGQTTVLQ